MAAKAPKESNQGLVITLVFFILATIGLGVATYYGFADQKKLEDAAKKAQGDAKKANDERDSYRTQTYLLRAYLGHPPEDANALEFLASNKEKFTKASFNLSDERKKELEAFRTTVAEKVEIAGKAGAWDADKKAPTKTYEQLLDDERAQVKQLQDSLKNADSEVAKARAAQKNAENALTTAKAEFDAQLKQAADDHQKAIASYKNQMEGFKKEHDRIKNERAEPKTANQLLAEREQALAEKNAALKELKNLQEKATALELRLSRFQDDKPIDLKVRGRIVSVTGAGTKAYIDLGSAHGLKPQTTFAVYGLASNGKPKSKPKGAIEVVNVVRDRLAEVVITAAYDPHDEGDIVTGRRKRLEPGDARNTDPIIKGDVLINPAWNPDAKIHVAIAGVIDLTGEGFDSMEAFMRALEKQNVVVDAYLDPKDFTLKGDGISIKTDYLVIGAQPYGADPTGKGGKAEALQKGMDALQVQARKYGVPTVKAGKFLEESGYRIGRRVED